MNEAVEQRKRWPQSTWTSTSQVWIWVLTVVCICVSSNSANISIPNIVTGENNSFVLLDFTGVEGPPTAFVELYGRKFKVNGGQSQDLDFLTISVRAGTDSPNYRMLLTLENMACYGNTNLDKLWIQDESGHRKSYCHTSPVDSVLLEGQREITIGIGPDWDTGLGLDIAAMRVTVYYEPGHTCECDNKWAFCCEPCPEARGSQTGYCMNRNMTYCDYSYYCPCLPGEEPDPVECPVNDGVNSPAMAFYLMILYVTIGIITAAGIIFCLPFFCFRKKPPVIAAQTQSRDRTRRNTPEPPPSWRPEFDNPPPPYEAPSEEYTLKELKVCDLMDEEPPPPSYESVIVKN